MFSSGDPRNISTSPPPAVQPGKYALAVLLKFKACNTNPTIFFSPPSRRIEARSPGSHHIKLKGWHGIRYRAPQDTSITCSAEAGGRGGGKTEGKLHIILWFSGWVYYYVQRPKLPPFVYTAIFPGNAGSCLLYNNKIPHVHGNKNVFL